MTTPLFIKDKDFVTTQLTILGGQARAVFLIIVLPFLLAFLATE
jgi:hypothetical protein